MSAPAALAEWERRSHAWEGCAACALIGCREPRALDSRYCAMHENQHTEVMLRLFAHYPWRSWG
jgi:hypothetical protein